MSYWIEKEENINDLEEVSRICGYLKDSNVKEVTTYRKEIAQVFATLGYDVKLDDGTYFIRRWMVEKEDLGCYM